MFENREEIMIFFYQEGGGGLGSLTKIFTLRDCLQITGQFVISIGNNLIGSITFKSTTNLLQENLAVTLVCQDGTASQLAVGALLFSEYQSYSFDDTQKHKMNVPKEKVVKKVKHVIFS